LKDNRPSKRIDSIAKFIRIDSLSISVNHAITLFAQDVCLKIIMVMTWYRLKMLWKWWDLSF